MRHDQRSPLSPLSPPLREGKFPHLYLRRRSFTGSINPERFSPTFDAFNLVTPLSQQANKAEQLTNPLFSLALTLLLQKRLMLSLDKILPILGTKSIVTDQAYGVSQRYLSSAAKYRFGKNIYRCSRRIIGLGKLTPGLKIITHLFCIT